MRKLISVLALALTLGLATLALAACEEGTSDDATIKNEAAVTNEEAAASPPGAHATGEQFDEGMSDDATIQNEAAVKDEAAAATPDPDAAEKGNSGY